MRLNDHELQCYSRQLSLHEIGVEGQIKLKNARVLCIGAGGLGAPLLQYLAAAGVGTIGIVDPDVVELSNLPRQIIYTQDDIGEQKVSAAKQYLQRMNPALRCNIYPEYFSQSNAEQFIAEYDVIADCTENLDNRYLTNDSCFTLNKPLVMAGISRFQGQISLFNGKCGPCFRCIFSSDDAASELPDCQLGGVLGVLPGVIGTLQAAMILMSILQLDAALHAKFYQFDLLTMQLNEYHIQRNTSCLLCSAQKSSVKWNAAFKSIQYDDLKLMQASGVITQLIDVRSIVEHNNFNIGGKLIPLDELVARLGEIHRDCAVILYCQSGMRSIAACRILGRHDFKDLSYLNGGLATAQ